MKKGENYEENVDSAGSGFSGGGLQTSNWFVPVIESGGTALTIANPLATVQPKIDWVRFNPIPDTTLKGISMGGTRVPEKEYSVEATSDFKSWKRVGTLDPDTTAVIKEAHCAVIDAVEFPNMVFIRLVERP